MVEGRGDGVGAKTGAESGTASEVVLPMSQVAQGCTGLHRVAQGCTGLHRVAQGCTYNTSHPAI